MVLLVFTSVGERRLIPIGHDGVGNYITPNQHQVGALGLWGSRNHAILCTLFDGHSEVEREKWMFAIYADLLMCIQNVRRRRADVRSLT